MAHRTRVTDLQDAFLSSLPPGSASPSSRPTSVAPASSGRPAPPGFNNKVSSINDLHGRVNGHSHNRKRDPQQPRRDHQASRDNHRHQEAVLKQPPLKPNVKPLASSTTVQRSQRAMLPAAGSRIPPQAPGAIRRTLQEGDKTQGHGSPSTNARNHTTHGRPVFNDRGPIVKSDESWGKRVQVAIMVNGLPTNITTAHLHQIFSREGPVETLEIFKSIEGRGNGRAKIRFRPPPSRAFWTSGLYHAPGQNGDKALELRVSLTELDHTFTIQSPSNPTLKLPEQTILKAAKIEFGFMYDPRTMMGMHQVTAEDDMKISFELNLRRRCIDIEFDLGIVDPRDPRKKASRQVVKPLTEAARIAVGGLNRVEKYRFRIPLDQLQEIQRSRSDGDQIVLTVSLETPPNFFRKAVGSQLLASHEEGATYWTAWDTWFRQTDIVYDPSEFQHASVTLKKPKPLIDIGRWTTYRLTFKPSGPNEKSFLQLRRSLCEYNIPIKDSVDDSAAIAPREPAVWEWIDKPVSKPSDVPTSPTSFWDDFKEEMVPALAFPVRYQLEVCISQGCLNEHNMSKAFVDKLAALETRKAGDILEYVAQRKTRVWDPMTIFEIKVIRGSASRPKIPHYCAYNRKATVTPSMVYFGTPQVEISNRVVRQYIEHADRFLRVQYTDEKFQGRIHSSDNRTGNAILTRIQRTMMNGITIGDRHFEFLAFGNSQFRENGAYFFAPTPFLTSAEIRQWMGDFTSIRVPAKFAARLGQCFSTTRAINGTRVEIREMPDVKRRHTDPNGRSCEFNFTDGVGKISEFLAKMVAGELKLPFVPSVLQFRLGGCKGVLTMWPEAKDREIHMRPSQYKFPAIHNGLEINRWSQFSAATLNRQIIIILSALGVRDDVFSRKLQLMLKNLSRAMFDEEMAQSLLQKYIDPNQMTMTISGMILDGFMASHEPFLMSLMRLWRAWSIKYLKEKAKILIEEGAFVLGCTDETRTLKGHFDQLQVGPAATMEERLASLPEIFIQVPSKRDAKVYEIVEGPCVFARNPSLHPGDVRVVMAVDRPGLRHLRDVVVLPQTGDRDLASMCSGGDLDGDDYMILWDPEMLPEQWNQAPMDYTAPNPKHLERQVTNRDIINFFVNYMKNDRLGQIAIAHLAHADRLDHGVRDEKCLRLAALHSQAVDYVKSGEPAYMSKDLKVHKYPHFMESRYRSPEKIYTSYKILGQLYDQVERVNFVPCYADAFDDRILTAYALDDRMLRDAREVKELYDAEMRRTMAHYDINTEFEVWSTFVMSYSYNIRDYKFHEEMGHIAEALKDTFRGICIERAGGRGFEVLGPFAAAMYRVTQQEMAEAVEQTRQRKMVGGREVPVRMMEVQSMPLMSFPWCLHDILGKIATNRRAGGEKAKADDEASARKKRDRVVVDESMKRAKAEEDVLETNEGVTHRGDLLKLFPDARPGHEEEADKTPEDGATGPTMPRVTPVATSDEEGPTTRPGDGQPGEESKTADSMMSLDGLDDLMGFGTTDMKLTDIRDNNAREAETGPTSILDMDNTSDDMSVEDADEDFMENFQNLSVGSGLTAIPPSVGPANVEGRHSGTLDVESPISIPGDHVGRGDLMGFDDVPAKDISLLKPEQSPVKSYDGGDLMSLDHAMAGWGQRVSTGTTAAGVGQNIDLDDAVVAVSDDGDKKDNLEVERTVDDGEDDSVEVVTFDVEPGESALEALEKLVG